MNEEQAKALRAPFPQEVIDLLPRVWCGQCREAVKQKRSSCENHQRKRCNDCNNNITEAHLHLSYVGHATTTDRLLSVDPEWTWEPVAFSEQTGLPQLDQGGGLWIRLTVAGVTRLGYGHADGKNGGDAIKEAIGDALRNAALRFGVAIDLWAKHDKPESAINGENIVGRGDAPQRTEQPANGNGQKKRAEPDDTPQAARSTLSTLCKARNLSIADVDAEYQRRSGGKSLGDETSPQAIRAFIDGINNGSVVVGEPQTAGAGG